jgi:biopolymer transport protein ExbD
MPRRSVTRFFIPLIDVLILLFCIFLLMPFVSGQPASETTPEVKTTPEKPLPDDVKTLQAMLAEEKMRVARLEKERQARLSDRLAVCVMEIDPKDGTLIYFDPERQAIKNEADAIRAIAKQKTLASKSGMVKDAYFLILYPRKKAPFPTAEQVDQMKAWFKDVPFAFDIPG